MYYKMLWCVCRRTSESDSTIKIFYYEATLLHQAGENSLNRNNFCINLETSNNFKHKHIIIVLIL